MHSPPPRAILFAFIAFLGLRGECRAEIEAVGGDWHEHFRGALAGKWLLFHGGDSLTVEGNGLFRIRIEIESWYRTGRIAPLCFRDVKGTLRHVGSGGGRRVDDEIRSYAPSIFSDSRSKANYIPADSYIQWVNEYFYLDGTATIGLVESGEFATTNLAIAPSTAREMAGDILRPLDHKQRRYRMGIYRNEYLNKNSVGQTCVGSPPSGRPR